MKVLLVVCCLSYLGLMTVSAQSAFDLDSIITSSGSGRSGYTCSCGRQNSRRIVNGRETLINEFPFMAGLIRTDTGMTFCGAAIITQRHALTAAHCTVHFPLNVTALNVAEHDLSTDQETRNEIYPIQTIIRHEQYNATMAWNDIALIVTARTIVFTRNVSPACVSSSDLLLTYRRVKVLGWGRTSQGGTQAQRLQEVDLWVTTNDECRRFYRTIVNATYPYTQICTFAQDRDACQGDSGGPVIWRDQQNDGRWVLVGLVSTGRGCASGRPGVNTQVSTFSSWISSRIRQTVPAMMFCERVNRWDSAPTSNSLF